MQGEVEGHEVQMNEYIFTSQKKTRGGPPRQHPSHHDELTMLGDSEIVQGIQIEGTDSFVYILTNQEKLEKHQTLTRTYQWARVKKHGLSLIPM